MKNVSTIEGIRLLEGAYGTLRFVGTRKGWDVSFRIRMRHHALGRIPRDISDKGNRNLYFRAVRRYSKKIERLISKITGEEVKIVIE